MKTDIFNNCKWLTFPDTDCNLTRTSFEADNIIKATLEITALGYFEAYLNGSALSDDKYIPPMSEYEKRDLTKINMPIYDEFSYTIYYTVYDITDKLINGTNILATHIGAGWYGQHKSLNEGMSKWGDNLLVFRITLTDRNGKEHFICSTENNTKWTKSFILESSLYFGEYHDMRQYSEKWNTSGYDDSRWNSPAVRTAPEAELLPINFPADKTVKKLNAKKIYSFGDTAIYDIGELASGYAVIRFNDKAWTNDTATVRYADELNEDGSLQFHYCGGTFRMQKDHFICDNSVKDFCLYPHFTWHAARYIEITGNADFISFEVVHTDLEQISSFSSDDDTLNWIFDAYVRTQKANVHGCVPSDCPHRERLGYTGDGQLTAPAVMSVFDGRLMYKKWIRDIMDGQDKKGGHVQHTAPFYGGGGGPGGWGGAICIVPYTYYKYYDDLSILKETYPAMKAYIKYMLDHSENDIVVREEPGGWCLGDWCPLHNEIKIPESFVNTYFLVKCAEITADTAKLLGKDAEASYYDNISENIKCSMILHFYDESTGSFCNGEQGADAFALDIKIGNIKTLHNLLEKYSSLKTFDTGIFGTYLLIKVLFEKNYASLAYDLLTNKEITSFYNMKKQGATTLWENWDGCDSRCHPMFGAIVEFFFSGILGIKMLKPGFKEISIDPANIPQLKEIKGTLGTVNGPITVNITTDENGQKIGYISIPDEITLI